MLPGCTGRSMNDEKCLAPPPEERCSTTALAHASIFAAIAGAGAPTAVALRGGGGEAHLAPLTYGGLAAFGARAGAALYACAAYDASRGEPPRLATLLRNSAAAAVAFVCLTERWTLAPLNAAIGRAELAFELDDLPAHAVVLDDAVAPAWAADECGKRAVPTFAFAPDRKTVGAFALAPRAPAPPFAGAPASLDTVALLLHTSGIRIFFETSFRLLDLMVSSS